MNLNMKRFYIVSICIIAFFTFSSTSLAATNGLLDMKKVRVVTGTTISETSNITDNNLTTTESLQSTDHKKKLVYTFSSPVNLTTMFTQFNTNSTADTKVYFYSADTPVDIPSSTDANLIGTTSLVATANNRNFSALSYKDVKKVIIHSNSNSSVLLAEFDLFGSAPAPDTTPPGNVGSLLSKGSDKAVDLSWNNPLDSDFSHVTIYRNDVLLVDNVKTTSYNDLQVVNDIPYTYKVVSVDTTGNKSVGVSTTATPSYIDTTPPDDVTDLNAIPTYDSVTLNFTLPKNADFHHVTLYKDGVAYADSTTNKFVISNLKEATMYSFRIVAIDKVGNQSGGVVKSISTLSTVDDTPPAPPTGLAFVAGNGGLNLSWNNNLEPDLNGYNIYVDGVKVNSSPIRKASYTLTGLKNETSYLISVTAIDKSDNESDNSPFITGTPSSTAIPVLALADYDLTDVADGATSWFSSLWLLIAFSAGIPLSFYVANRIKLLFIA